MSTHRQDSPKTGQRVGYTPHTLDEWGTALEAGGAKVTPEKGGRGYRFAPCPACGGGTEDKGWLRQGNKGVVAGCNGGCSFPDIARAVFPNNGPAPGRTMPPPDHGPQPDADEKEAKLRKAMRKRWADASPCTSHPYLEEKGHATPKGLRCDGKTLLIPIRRVGAKDSNDVVGIQRISPAKKGWRKRYQKGSAPKGAHFAIHSTKARFILAEGIATALAIHVSIAGTDQDATVVTCFTAGNLLPVAVALHAKYPDASIRVAADNDRVKPGKVNPGVKYAKAAAEAVGGRWCVPDPEDRSSTDYDDLWRLEGPEAVRRWLDPDMAADVDTTPPKPKEAPPPDPEDDAEAGYVPRKDMADTQQRCQVDPTALAHRLLDRMADQILIVSKPYSESTKGKADNGSTALMMLPTGRWTHSPDPWRVAIVKELQALLLDIGRAVANRDMTVPAANRRSNRVHQSLRYIDRTVDGVRKAMWTAWDVYMTPHRYTATFDRPRIVDEEDLDADLDMMGFANGIVNLRTGQLLDPVAGADKLITMSTGIRFDPEKATGADQLFSHLEDDMATWWVQALAWMLRGRPSRRLWLVVGQRNSGKTTVATAVLKAFGPRYAAVLPDGTLIKQRGDAAPPGAFAFAAPIRFTLCEEPPPGQIDKAFIKSATGGGMISIKRLYKDPYTVLATGSLVIFTNPGSSVPKLGLADPALADRLRELPYPQLPKVNRDPAFLADTIQSTEFREAVAAKLILAGVGLTRPPSSPEAVQEASQRRLELDLSPFETFIKRIVPGHAGDFLASEKLWIEWCHSNDFNCPPSDPSVKVGRFTPRSFAMRVKRERSELPQAVPKRGSNSSKRGYPGWKIR